MLNPRLASTTKPTAPNVSSADEASKTPGRLTGWLKGLFEENGPVIETALLSAAALVVVLYVMGWLFLRGGLGNMEVAIMTLLVPLSVLVVVPLCTVPWLSGFFARRETKRRWWLFALVLTVAELVVAVALSYAFLLIGGGLESAYAQALLSVSQGEVSITAEGAAAFSELPFVLQNATTLIPCVLIGNFIGVYVAARLGVSRDAVS